MYRAQLSYDAFGSSSAACGFLLPQAAGKNARYAPDSSDIAVEVSRQFEDVWPTDGGAGKGVRSESEDHVDWSLDSCENSSGARLLVFDFRSGISPRNSGVQTGEFRRSFA